METLGLAAVYLVVIALLATILLTLYYWLVIDTDNILQRGCLIVFVMAGYFVCFVVIALGLMIGTETAELGAIFVVIGVLLLIPATVIASLFLPPHKK